MLSLLTISLFTVASHFALLKNKVALIALMIIVS